MYINKTCIIPIRKNSKSVRNKNIKKFRGKPLVFHVIEKCIKSKLFDKIIISTDSKKYIDIIKKKFKKKFFFVSDQKKTQLGMLQQKMLLKKLYNTKSIKIQR